MNLKFSKERRYIKLELDEEYRNMVNNIPENRVEFLKSKLGITSGKSSSARFFSNFGKTFKGVRTFYDMKELLT